jgi:DNA primase large subunit
MLRQDFNRIDPKRRNVVDYRKRQFADPQFKESTYQHRLNFYIDAPTAEITLEQFEQWAIDRLRSMPPNFQSQRFVLRFGLIGQV